MNYRISVLMGIYNCAHTLPEALDSLYAQTYKNFKLILCDDGSKDNTYEIARKYADKHENIILLSNGENKGLNYTLNHCLKYADTEYCARMDGDDISMPTRFEKEILFLDSHPEYEIVGHQVTYFDEHGPKHTSALACIPTKKSFIYGSPFIHPTCMVRTRAYKLVNGYTVDKKLIRVEDFHLWAKMFSIGIQGYVLPESLQLMRDDNAAYARRNWTSRKNEIYVRFISYKMLGLPWYYQIYTLRPLIAYIAPKWVYNLIHNKNK